MAIVKFEVDQDGKRAWIAVDDKDVTSSVDLKPGKHILTWWIYGDAGNSISIVGKAGQREVVNVKGSKIPSGEHSHAYFRRFEV